MKISVALCTFNGRAFVREQLESVLSQTLTPDEVVVWDDASGDGTLATVDALRDRFDAAGIVLVAGANERTVGVRANFERCIAETTGDLVFLCDQDDIWHPEKVATMAAEFERRHDLALVFTDADLIDATGRSLGHTLFDALRVTRRERRLVREGSAFEVLIRRNLATGATVAFRRYVHDVASPFPEGWLHDEWLAVIAAATSTIDLSVGTSIDYRQHDTNQVGVRRLSLSNFRARLTAPAAVARGAARDRANALAERLQALEVPAARRALASEKLAFQERRLHYPANRAARLVPILRQAFGGRYHRVARGAIAVARDVFVPGPDL